MTAGHGIKWGLDYLIDINATDQIIDDIGFSTRIKGIQIFQVTVIEKIEDQSQ